MLQYFQNSVFVKTPKLQGIAIASTLHARRNAFCITDDTVANPF